MGDNLVAGVVTVATAIVGVAVIAVIVSNGSNSAGVLTSAGNAFSNALNAATSPVRGGSSLTGGVSPITLN